MLLLNNHIYIGMPLAWYLKGLTLSALCETKPILGGQASLPVKDQRQQ